MNEQYPLALPEGSVLAGQYVIVKVLGQGGFGITYEARDHKTDARVAIKEFFPDAMATRTHTTVMPLTGERGDSFQYGKECFLREAETLAQFIGNENIVRIYSYFEENGTAYFVMDFVEGTSFDDNIKQRGGKLSFEEASKILIPVMDALGAVHEKGIIHRDVTPDNIYITGQGTVKLLDFGAARYSIGDKSRSLDVVLKHGFAPKEQYTRRGRQGPFTDIYALGATFYFALTGKRPPDSVERMDEDDLVTPSTLGVSLPADAEAAILKSLNVQPADRFQSMKAFKTAMLKGSGALQDTGASDHPTFLPAGDAAKTVSQRFFEAPQGVKASASEHTAAAAKEDKKPKKLLPFIAIALAAVAGIVVAVFALGGNSNNGADTNSSAVAAAASSTQEEERSVAASSTQESRQETSASGASSAGESTRESSAGGAASTGGNAQESAAAEVTRNLYPVIIGNHVNNLLNGSSWTWDGQSFGMTETDSEVYYMSKCLSRDDGLLYAVRSQDNAAVVIRDDILNVVPELEEYAGRTTHLLVSEEYFFVYDNKEKILDCVDRQSGDALGSRILESAMFTIFDNGFLVYIEGEKGNQKVYFQPAGDLEEEYAERYYYGDLPEEVLFDCVLYGGDTMLYVSGDSDTGQQVIIRYDLSKDMEDNSDNRVSFKLDRHFWPVNVYGDYIYYYGFYYNSETKVRSDQWLYRYQWGGENAEPLYQLEDSENNLYGVSLSEDGSRLFFTQLPYTYASYSDGSEITTKRDYSYTK